MEERRRSEEDISEVVIQSEKLDVTRYVEAPRKKRTKVPLHMERFPRTRNGIKAFSSSFHCTQAKTQVRVALPTSKPIIVEELQGFDCPPHCSASKRQNTAPKKIKHPTGSMYRIFSARRIFRLSSPKPLTFRKIDKQMRTTAPRGRLLHEVKL